MEHCEEPHPYPQGTMIHQKGNESFEDPNYNKNPREAQELKKEGPPLCRRIKENNERTKKETKKKQKKEGEKIKRKKEKREKQKQKW